MTSVMPRPARSASVEKELRRRDYRRVVEVDRKLFVVTVTATEVRFRPHGYRYSFALPWSRALSAAELLAGEARFQEKHRRRGLRRFA